MANTNNDLDDLICNEVDFSFQDKQDEERAKRYAAETKIYFIINDFLDILNQNAILHEFKLKKNCFRISKNKKTIYNDFLYSKQMATLFCRRPS